MSIGYTNGGALFNGVQMPAGDGWELVERRSRLGHPRNDRLRRRTACSKVSELLPGAPKHVHRPHQRAPRRAPLASREPSGGTRRRHQLLLSPRRSALVRHRCAPEPSIASEPGRSCKTLITDTDVELILMDRSVQRLVRALRGAARRRSRLGRSAFRRWRRRYRRSFGTPRGTPPTCTCASTTRWRKRPAAALVRRFASSATVDRAAVAASCTTRSKRARRWVALAKKYGVSAKVIQAANGMKSNLLRATQDYKIPQSGGVRAAPQRHQSSRAARRPSTAGYACRCVLTGAVRAAPAM